MTPGRRIVVIGPSGAGKSTVSRRLAAALDIQHVELDAIYWDANWTERPTAECRSAVAAATAGNDWIVDGNYRGLRDITWPRATMVIWLDVPYLRTMAQIISRTFVRCLTGRRVCGDNRETFRLALFSRHSVVYYAAGSFHRRRREYRTLLGFAGPDVRSPLLSKDVLIRVLRRPEDADRVIAELAEANPATMSPTVEA